MDGLCNKPGSDEKCTQNFGSKTIDKETTLKTLGLDGKIIVSPVLVTEDGVRIGNWIY
jgi:hypothetical protein